MLETMTFWERKSVCDWYISNESGNTIIGDDVSAMNCFLVAGMDVVVAGVAQLGDVGVAVEAFYSCRLLVAALAFDEKMLLVGLSVPHLN